MGRITNVIGERLRKKSDWGVNSLLLSEKASIEFYFLKRSINWCILEKMVINANFILNGLNIIEKNGKVIIKLCMYDTEAAMIEEGLLVHSNFKFEFLVRLSLVEKRLTMLLEKCVPNAFSIHFLMATNKNVSAKLVSVYISQKLKQGFTLGEILWPLKKFLKFSKILKGFRIECSGRFTRRQRASFLRIKEGTIPFSSKSIKIDYSEDFAILKFGKCGIKVWLLHSKIYKPYKIGFKENKIC